MRLAFVLAGSLALAACSESGSGTVVQTYARLPLANGYTVGFAADRTPLLGFTFTPGPIARFEGGNWVAVTQDMVITDAIGSDNDGTPLVAYRKPDQTSQVAQLVGDKLVDLADTAMPATPSAIFQNTDGARYAIAGGFGFAMRLAPGSRQWTNSTVQTLSAARDVDGTLLGWTPNGLVKIGPNDMSTLVVSCNTVGPNVCGGGQFGGVDADGRRYFTSFEGVVVFDPSNPAMPTTTIALPQGAQPVNLVVTSELALVAAFGSNQPLFALPRGALRPAAVRTEEIIDNQAITMHRDLDGNIYVASGDWLGLAAIIGGD